MNKQESGIGRGINHLYALSNHHKHKDSTDVVTHTIQFFNFTIYVLLDPRNDFIFCNSICYHQL